MSKDSKQDETAVIDLKSNENLPTGKIDSFGGLTKNELMNILRIMNLSRTIDHKVMTLLKQGKAFFHIAGAGHEATQTAFGLAMQKGVDWAFPYYREMCFMIALGMKPEDLF